MWRRGQLQRSMRRRRTGKTGLPSSTAGQRTTGKGGEMHFEDIKEDVSTSLSDSDTKEALNEDKGMEEKHGVDHEEKNADNKAEKV